jgi:hypothetical protein
VLPGEFHIGVAVIVVLSSSLVAASRKTATEHRATPVIDPTQLTLSAGRLPVVQVDEPF